MYIKRTIQKSGATSVRVVESSREGKSVRQTTVRHIGTGKTKAEIKHLEEKAEEVIFSFNQARNLAFPGMEKVNNLKTKKKGRKSLKKRVRSSRSREPVISDTFERERVIQGITGVGGALYDQLGYQTIIQGGYKDNQWNEYLKASVLARIADPQSKRKTVETLRDDYSQKIPLEGIYRMMDHLYFNIHRVKEAVSNNTLSLFKQQVEVLFFDVTTLYFESFVSDGLKEPGFSKDGKIKEVQVVLALVTNFEGHPLSYEVFPGNMSEGQTLIKCVEDLKKIYSVRRTVLVADRAMFSEKNLGFMDKSGLDYVVAAKLRSLPKFKKEKILNSGINLNEKKGKEHRESASVLELKHRGRRLIVSWSGKRANKSAKDRERLINCLMKRVKNGRISVKSLISNHGTKKYIQVKGDSDVLLNEEKIRLDARWDGFHGIVTNIKDEQTKALLSRYRRLWKIEEAFRANKSTLRMRPIYHWTKRRIRAHIAICFLAYSLSYTLKSRLKAAGLDLSIDKIRGILKRDQYSVIEDKNTGKRYHSPSKWTEPIKKIYSAFGLKRVSVVTPID